MNIGAAGNLQNLCHVIARVRDDHIGESRKFTDDAAVAQVDPILSRRDWKFAGQFMKKNQQASRGIFCLPFGEDRRKPYWTTVTMIGPPRVMQKNIRATRALERTGKVGGFGVEFGAREMTEAGGLYRRAFRDEKP